MRNLLILIALFLVISGSGFAEELPSNSLSIRLKQVQDPKEFSSAIGGFSILFPGVPNETSGTLNVGKTIVRRHIFKIEENNKLYTVMYFDVPHADDSKSKADLLVGFRTFALTEFNGEILNDDPVSIDNNEGRLLKISIPKRGIVKVLIVLTATRLYEISVEPEKRGISADEIESASKRFLESFRLTSIDHSGEGEVDAYLRSHPELAQRTLEASAPNRFLNGKALRLPLPEFPLMARSVRASGTIIVRIIIDEEGKVIAAQAIGGHPLLISAAEQAARKALFTPTLEQGKPVKVLGKVQYNFIGR